MPLPSSGQISADDLNEELGNSPGTQIDFESAALSLLETAVRPHSIDEFYGTSLGEDFLFSDWDGSVSISEFGVIAATVGNATSRTINTSNFLAVTSATARNVSITIVAPSEFNGEPVTNAGTPITGTKPVTQPAVGRYLSISADDTSLAGDDTSVSLTVTDTYYNDDSQTPWEITTEAISDNSLPVVSFLPITGTGTETVDVAVDDNPNGSTRSVRFRVTGTVGGKSSFVDVSQASYTPAVPPTVSIDSVSPSAPFSYNGVNQVVFTISRTIASSFTAQISPGIDSNGAIFSTTQPENITRNNSTSISGTNNTFYIQIPERTDTDEDTKTDYLTVNVSANGLSDYAPYELTQEGYSLPVYTWGGSVSIDRYTGDVVVSNDDSAGTITISPISFNEYVTTSTPREVTIDNIIIPSGYQNADTVAPPITFYPNQSAIPAELTFTPQSSTTISGNITSFNVFVDDLYYDNTSWFIDESSSNTLQEVTLSPDSGVGSGFVVISFDSNNSGTRYGTFTLRGGSTSPSITITQNTYTPAPTISITDVTPSGPYSYEGQANIGISVSRTNATSFNASIAPSIDDANAVFSELQPSGITYHGPTSISGTGTSFKVEIPSRSDGTVNTYSSFLSVNVSTGGGSDSDSLTLEQSGLVIWNTSPSSLSFGSAQESLSITLNTNLSWTAQISGTGFSIEVGDTSGTGTATFGILATNNSGELRTGILSFASPGQTTIQVTLTQDAYEEPTPVSWSRIPTSITWGGSDTFYDTIDVLFQNRTSTITWKAVLDSSQHFEISLSSSSGYGKQILSITNDDLIYVRPKDPNNTSVSYDDTLRFTPVTTGTGLSTLTVSLSQSPAELGCLVQGTKITMSDNSIKRIQHLKIGDSLKSVNIVGLPDGENESLQFQTDNLEYTQSTAIVTNITQLVRKTIISFNEGLLQSSIDHNHFIRRDGVYKFLTADKVFVGDYLMNEVGEFIEITLVEEYSDMNYIVYKIDVEEHDVFFANGILTHNAKIEF
jgi:hypothetical protein